MIRRKPFELMVGKDLFDLPVEGPVKSEPFGTHAILCEKEPSISQESPQDLPLLESEGFKLVLSRHVKEGVKEEIGVANGSDAPFLQATYAGSELQLFDHGLRKMGVGVPFATAIFNLGKKELGESGAPGKLQAGEKRRCGEAQS